MKLKKLSKVCRIKGRINDFATLDTPSVFCLNADMPVKLISVLTPTFPNQSFVIALIRLKFTYYSIILYYYVRR